MNKTHYALVVDDNKMNLLLVKKALETGGLDKQKYVVITASNTDEAAEILMKTNSQKIKFDLMVTDTDISGKRIRKNIEAQGGYTLSRYVRNNNEKMRVILHSSAFDKFKDVGLISLVGFTFYKHIKADAEKYKYNLMGRYELMRKIGIQINPRKNMQKGFKKSWELKRRRK